MVTYHMGGYVTGQHRLLCPFFINARKKERENHKYARARTRVYAHTNM